MVRIRPSVGGAESIYPRLCGGKVPTFNQHLFIGRGGTRGCSSINYGSGHDGPCPTSGQADCYWRGSGCGINECLASPYGPGRCGMMPTSVAPKSSMAQEYARRAYEGGGGEETNSRSSEVQWSPPKDQHSWACFDWFAFPPSPCEIGTL